MSFAGMSEDKRVELANSTRKEMEALAQRMRELIVAQPPLDLLGYIYGQRLLISLRKPRAQVQDDGPADGTVDDTQLLLEYVHAALASTPPQRDRSLQEAMCAELFELVEKLKAAAMFHAMASSAGTKDGAFGPDTADMEFQAKSTWVLLRGNRYQVLEGEFYEFVLAPHDALLREEYGIGAAEISAGFQCIANAVRVGQSEAFQTMQKQFDEVQTLAKEQAEPFPKVVANWNLTNPDGARAAALAFDDILRGGICNVSRHTRLPAALLADLAYERGEEADFFADGPYSGTPFRTLPARKKPLVKINQDYYGVDTCLTRDAGYRALLWNLLRRRPEYLVKFNTAQKVMSEAAFTQILVEQLTGATVHQEVYYRDPVTKNWVENDTIVIIDDVMLLVEAKAGAAATVASPAEDFARHTRAVQDLVLKAYHQCKRFFEYLASAGEVSIYRRSGGRYLACGLLRQSDYRVLVPIGLTVESFSPVSTMCKELPGVAPILGNHPFISMSIDDLFVLKRLLPTMGEFAHYLEVRQVIAGMKGVRLFDELDHLGAYITKNRFDRDIEEQRIKDNPTMIVWDGMSKPVDDYFSHPDWETQPVPAQGYPSEIRNLLTALDKTRMPGWLAAESHIRNYGAAGRKELAAILKKCRTTLAKFPSRHFLFSGIQGLFIWLQRTDTFLDQSAVRDKARAAMLATNTANIITLAANASATAGYVSAECLKVEVPRERTVENAHIYDDAERIRARHTQTSIFGAEHAPVSPRRLGRNDPCWCGSNIKFKKCHGPAQ